MKKIVLVINAETNTVEQNLLLTDDNMPRVEMLKAGSGFVDISVPKYDTEPASVQERASDEAIAALREKLMPTAPPVNNEVIQVSNAQELCHDEWSGRFFMSNLHEMERAASMINHEIAMEGNAELNTFYDHLGLQPIVAGRNVGWSGEGVDLRFGSVLTPEGRPAISVWFHREPVPGMGLDR